MLRRQQVYAVFGSAQSHRREVRRGFHPAVHDHDDRTHPAGRLLSSVDSNGESVLSRIASVACRYRWKQTFGRSLPESPQRVSRRGGATLCEHSGRTAKNHHFLSSPHPACFFGVQRSGISNIHHYVVARCLEHTASSALQTEDLSVCHVQAKQVLQKLR